MTKNDDGPVGLGPQFLKYMDDLVLTVVIQQALDLPHGMEPPLLRISCNDKIIDFIVEDNENGGLWNKVLYFPLRGLNVSDFFKENLVFTAYPNQHSLDKVVRKASRLIGDLDYDVVGEFRENFSLDTMNIKSYVEFSAILERKVNFIDEEEVLFPYNFSKKELGPFIESLYGWMSKKGVIKDKTSLFKTIKHCFHAKDIIDGVLDLAVTKNILQFRGKSRDDIVTFLRCLMECGTIINPTDGRSFITETTKDSFKFAGSPEDKEFVTKTVATFIEKKDRIFKTKVDVFSPPTVRKGQLEKQQTQKGFLNITIDKVKSKDKKKFGRKELKLLLSKRSGLTMGTYPQESKRRSIESGSNRSRMSNDGVSTSLTRQGSYEISHKGSDGGSSGGSRTMILNNIPPQRRSSRMDIIEGEFFKRRSDVDEGLRKRLSNASEIDGVLTNISEAPEQDEMSSNPQSLVDDASLKTHDRPDSIQSLEFALQSLIVTDENVNERVFACILKKDMESVQKHCGSIDVKWKNPQDDRGFLHAAVLGNQIKIAEILIQKGVDVNGVDKSHRSPLSVAANNGLNDLSVLLLGHGAKVAHKDSYGNTPLMLALKSHNWELVDNLVLFGADINAKKDNGMSAIHEAVVSGDIEMMQQIYQMKNVKLNLKDHNGKTALLKSIEKCPIAVIMSLLQQSQIDLTLADEMSRNVLHYTARYNRIDIIDYIHSLDDTALTKFTKLLTQQDSKKNRVPLHLAVEISAPDLVKEFIKLHERLKIDLKIKDVNGCTPYDIAFIKIEKEMEKEMEKQPDLSPEQILEKAIEKDMLLVEEMLFKK